jgi:hypothetical protein
MFCDKCGMSYDITNNVKMVLRGGKTDSDSDQSDSEEQDVKINTTKINIGKIIDKIIKSTKLADLPDNPEIDIKQSPIVLTKEDGADYVSESDVINSKAFQDLNAEDKSIVLNKIKFYVPKKKKKVYEVSTDEIDDNKSYFVCTNCGNYKEIQPKTLIFSKNINISSEEINLNMCTNNIYDYVLPRDRNYTCPNKKCPSHDDPIIRVRVTKRYKNIFKIINTCCACQFSWST